MVEKLKVNLKVWMDRKDNAEQGMKKAQAAVEDFSRALTECHERVKNIRKEIKSEELKIAEEQRKEELKNAEAKPETFGE